MFEMLVPKLRVNTVFDIALDELYRQGYRGIITDLDNTLVGAKAPVATPELLLWFEKVKELGFKLIIVSNNNMERVSRFATPLNIEFVHQARKPSNAPFLKAMKQMELPLNKRLWWETKCLLMYTAAIALACILFWYCQSPSRTRGSAQGLIAG